MCEMKATKQSLQWLPGANFDATQSATNSRPGGSTGVGGGAYFIIFFKKIKCSPLKLLKNEFPPVWKQFHLFFFQTISECNAVAVFWRANASATETVAWRRWCLRFVGFPLGFPVCVCHWKLMNNVPVRLKTHQTHVCWHSTNQPWWKKTDQDDGWQRKNV